MAEIDPAHQLAVGSYIAQADRGGTATVNVFQGPAYPRLNYRSEIASLIDFYIRTFVGREEELAHLASFAAQEEPGYLLVEALSGHGKSALMAQLVHRHEAGRWGQSPMPELLYFFVRQEGLRNAPVAFLQAINSQLLEMLRSSGDVPTDVNALRSQFSQLWTHALEATCNERPLLLLVDGLDEIAPGRLTIAHLLPASLASYVHVVVTSRPNPVPLQQVDLTHPFRESSVLRLHTFGETEIRALLQEYSTAKAKAVALAPRVLAMTKGEPLFARFVCQEVAIEGSVALVRLEQNPPPDVDAYFRQQFRHLDTLAESNRTWSILGLLVVALGGMTVEEIAEVLDLGKRQVRKAIQPIIRFLLGEDRLELMHLQLRKIVEEEFSVNELAMYRQRLLGWCQSYETRSWPRETPDYILVHYARHLATDGQIDDLYALVESQDWTSTKYVDTPWADSLIQDLYLASDVAVDKGVQGWLRSMAYQLRRALVEDLMSRLSDEVIVFMAKLGRIDQALHYAKRDLWQPFQLFHRIADVVAESQPDRAFDVLMQSIHLFDQSSILNQYGARLVVAKIILKNERIMAEIPTAAQKAQDLVRQAQRIEAQVSESDTYSYKAQYLCPILVLTDRLEEAKELAESLPLPARSQAFRYISVELSPDHSQKVSLAKKALSILKSVERNAEVITRKVQAIVNLLPFTGNEQREELIQRLIAAEKELHSYESQTMPSWSWVIENIAKLDLERVKDIVFNSEWPSHWKDAGYVLIKQIALQDPQEALDTAESQYSNYVAYRSILVDIIRVVAVERGEIYEAEELINRYSKKLSSSPGRMSEAYLALAEAYLAQGNRQKAKEVFDEQVFAISDQGVRRGRSDVLVAMVARSSVLESCKIGVIFDHLKNIGEGRLYSSERLLGRLAARWNRIDLVETYKLGLEARIGAAYEVASRDPDLAIDLCARWNLWNRMKAKWEISRLRIAIRAAQVRKDRSKLEELVSCFDGEETPHHICKNMRALPTALYQLIEEAQIEPDDAKQIVERVYPILLGWKCPEEKEECECYADSAELLGYLIVIMARLDRCRAKQMVASLPSGPTKVSTLKGIAYYAEFDDGFIEEIIESSKQAFSQPLDLAGSYLDLAANVLPREKSDWITHLLQLAEPLVDDQAWPQPPTKLKVNRARALMKLIGDPDQITHVRDAVDNVGGSLRDKLRFLDVLAERAVCWSQEDRLTLLRRIWELATIKRIENVEALIAFAVPIIESLVDDKEKMFWKLYDYVEWAYQDLPPL